MFEFNFGDTEVFWILLDLFAIVIGLRRAASAVPNELRLAALGSCAANRSVTFNPWPRRMNEIGR